jgi:hypothetical protein
MAPSEAATQLVFHERALRLSRATKTVCSPLPVFIGSNKPSNIQVDSKGFRLCCITELLGYRTLSTVRYSKTLQNTKFRVLDLFPSSGEGGDTYSVGSLKPCIAVYRLRAATARDNVRCFASQNRDHVTARELGTC